MREPRERRAFWRTVKYATEVKDVALLFELAMSDDRAGMSFAQNLRPPGPEALGLPA